MPVTSFLRARCGAERPEALPPVKVTGLSLDEASMEWTGTEHLVRDLARAVRERRAAADGGGAAGRDAAAHLMSEADLRAVVPADVSVCGVRRCEPRLGIQNERRCFPPLAHDTRYAQTTDRSNDVSHARWRVDGRPISNAS